MSALHDLWIRNGTIVAGEVTIRDDEATGARPGRLIRGAR